MHETSGHMPEFRHRPMLFEDHFDAPALDRTKWFPYYLPHWSTPSASEARFRIADSILRLVITEDQPRWLPEMEGALKVSGLQTGHHSGPHGGALGQHRSREGLVVKTTMPDQRLFLPRYCRLEMRARARLNPWNLAALWLIGYEDTPECSGEITLFEAFGSNVTPDAARIGRGIKPINDPRLRDEFEDGELPIRLEDWHVYALNWSRSGVEFYVDDRLVSRANQSPDYPMQLMLNLYDLPGDYDRSNPKDAWFDIDLIRAYGADE